MPTSWTWHPVSCGSSRRNKRWRPVRFLTCLMTYRTIEEIVVVERYVDPDDFREALDHAPPGIMDERSWAPPMPRRVIP